MSQRFRAKTLSALMNRKQRRAAAKLGQKTSKHPGHTPAAAVPAHVAELAREGVKYQQAGRLAEAIAAYSQAIGIKPDYAEAHSNLGNALSAQGSLDEAIAAYRQAIGIKADFAEAHSNLGVALRDQGRLDDTIAAYRQAIGIKPDYAEAHSNLVVALRDQ